MSTLLGLPTVQGLSPVLSQVPDQPTTVLQVPPDAACPCHIAVDNPHATANVYLKWIPLDATGPVASSNYSRRLKAGEGYVWDFPPRNARLIAISDLSDCQLAIDANWSYAKGQQ